MATPRRKRPRFDRLAREGVLVEEAVAHVPQTRPSHASILTGRYPYEHGLRDNAAGPLAPGMPTLATVLKAAGYDTAAFIGAYPVSRSSGLDRGFDVYDDPFETAVDGRTERRAQEVVDRALGWLARPRGRPFVAWVHLFDPHAPYIPPPPFAGRFARRPYDGEVAYADSQVERLLAWLDDSGQRRATLVVVTSDHGESLGEHGEEEHGLLVYDSTLRVPLVLSWPGHLPAGARARGQFRSVDLLPTLLELLGVPAVRTSGTSRADVLARGGRIPDNESYAESLYGALHFGWAQLRALRAEGWKYIEAPRPELYHLTEDPGEMRNVLQSREQVASGMRQSLGRFGGGAGEKAVAAPIDHDALERLAALGYVGGVAGTTIKVTGKDPKDGVREFERERQAMREALRLFKQNDIDRALPLLEQLARGPTGSFNVEFYLGRALLEKDRRHRGAAPLAQGDGGGAEGDLDRLLSRPGAARGRSRIGGGGHPGARPREDARQPRSPGGQGEAAPAAGRPSRRARGTGKGPHPRPRQRPRPRRALGDVPPARRLRPRRGRGGGSRASRPEVPGAATSCAASPWLPRAARTKPRRRSVPP